MGTGIFIRATTKGSARKKMKLYGKKVMSGVVYVVVVSSIYFFKLYNGIIYYNLNMWVYNLKGKPS